MGQSSSRVREVESPPSTSTPRRNPESGAEDGQDSVSSPSTSTRRGESSKRRSTVRRSIINLVKSPSKNDEPNTSSRRASGKRKSWLKSRRWSKAPAVMPNQAESEDVVADTHTATAATNGATTSATILPAIAPKETETTAAAATASVAIPMPATLEEQQPASHSDPTLDPEQQQPESVAPDAVMGDSPSITQNREELQTGSVPSTADESGETTVRSDSDPTQSSSFVPSPDTPIPPRHHDHEVQRAEVEDSIPPNPAEQNSPAQPLPHTDVSESAPERSETSPNSAQTASTPNTPSPQNRQFPPPGTLVVVQGVVHTTDVPRPASDSPSSPPSNPLPLHTDHQQHSQTQASTRLSDSGLGSRRRRSVSNASRRRSDVGSSTRNRLSALFGGSSSSRPASMASGRPSSSASNTVPDESQLPAEVPAAISSSSSTDPAAVASTSRLASDESSDTLTTAADVNVSSSGSSSDAGSSSTNEGREDSESDATTVSATTEGISGSVSNEDGGHTRGADRNPQTQTPPPPSGGGMISSSSIDVLGTLLSVAAAATAASLLTGSSDPILPPTAPNASAPRSASPSPGPGLGLGPDPFGLGGIGLGGGGAGNAGVGMGVGAGGRTERVRQAWGNIRERLGLRPSSGSASAPASPTPTGTEFSIDPHGAGTGAGATGRDESVPLLSDIDGRRSELESQTSAPPPPPPRAPTMEARDRMLAEMTRAFQLGLGLNGPAPSTGTGGDDTLGADGSREGHEGGGFGLGRPRFGELPPEGSFERFLVDLQTDLRVALGGGEQPHQPSQQPRQDVEEPEDDERETNRDHDREDIDELYRLIAEAEQEVRQRQRMIAERHAALRALVSGAAAALGDNANTTSTSTAQPRSPPATTAPSSSPPPPSPAVDRRARVDTAPDSDDEHDASMPSLEDVSDTEDSDSEDEAPARNLPAMNRNNAASTSAAAPSSPATERTEASLARLSSMIDRAASSDGNRTVNSLTDALNRRRALGIGRTPPVAPVSAPAVASPQPPPPLEPVRESPTTQAPLLASPASVPRSLLDEVLSLGAEQSATSAPTPTALPFTNPAPPAPTSPPEPSTTTATTTTTRPQAGSRNAIEDGTGRINWWRLYRFPPIAAPPPRGLAAPGAGARAGNDATQAQAQAPPLNASPLQDSPALQPDMASVTASPNVPVPSSNPNENQTSPQASPPQQAASAPTTVVPVIVVGLQSVNLAFLGPGAGPGPTHAAPTDGAVPPPAAFPPPPPPHAAPTVADGTEEAVAGDEAEDGSGTGENRHHRRWPSRAAEALRNLRPGRRPQPRPGAGLLPPDMLDGPGSRTFLIYVIGGYYPPDHHIVTGDPDTLDSFEALLDIAELLGQVKPPTASKEDIERSGLEVIKATQVGQYEQEKKISSNCTERCLICLEDYHKEDDVRVLTCHHAFHMDCVDKWLQEGKNNCPACRGAGVATGSS
ncbi:hypothetical protein V5O48_003408 [Marasmius crinis-equi]|uniref:RING-type domain-containing protein n=1 Tax=Marasmius crinis-equi TaxID=585013 RepID=A0ABR3FSW8_9AGAR